MMLLWALAGIPLGVYNISRPLHIALQIQAQILTGFSLITWGQCLYYNAVCIFMSRVRCATDTVEMVILEVSSHLYRCGRLSCGPRSQFSDCYEGRQGIRRKTHC